MDSEKIKQYIETGLSGATAYIEGEDGQHFTAIVISEQFSGKSRVEKQQLVYATLKNHIKDGTIHAISIKTLTPEEWRKQSMDDQHG
ncbi:MAG TPA: BolA family protein [Gammaproteobacteria bacterium]|jgi:acid stress-induced BolA-like protein IbaG/YrbA|nr:BolA family protein [Gammaproteobacteria bacterium]